MVPLNIVTQQALEELIPLAKELDVGIAAMKPYSAKQAISSRANTNPPFASK
jgi:aryl-alcohol dehydrogenase-like predicted oxidoreductase